MGWQDAPTISGTSSGSWQDAPEVDAPAQFGNFHNLAMGVIKGASDIGSTLLRPLDATGITGMSNQDRRAALADFFQSGANPDSLAFKGGELGTQVAGTAGAGGLIGKGLNAIPVIARTAAPVINSIQSGGFMLGSPAATTLAGSAGNAALRATGGAIGGGAGAGLVDPDNAGSGALIGSVIPGGVKAAGAVGGLLADVPGFVAKHVIGGTTGAGADALTQAYQAGLAGNQVFTANMRGDVPFDDVLSSAKQALQNMKIAKNNAYRNGMTDISADKSVIDFSPIQDAMDNVSSSGTFKGKVVNPKSAGTVEELDSMVKDWAASNPAEYHTPEGLDALKQAIGDIRSSAPYGTPARISADQIYNAVKGQITAQAPTYARVMKEYADAADQISEIQGALSLGEKSKADTAIRKFQSLMRNNVATNYGNRLDLASTLQDAGGKDILPAVAGQALNSWTPRGIVGAMEKGGGLVGAALKPELLAAVPFMSPRLMGEAAYGLGRAASVPQNAMGLLGNSALGNNMSLMAQDPAFRSLLTVTPSVAFSSE